MASDRIYTKGEIIPDADTGEPSVVVDVNENGKPISLMAVSKMPADNSTELDWTDRARYAFAPDTAQGHLDAIKGLGKQGVIENGKAYVIEGGKKYEPDSPDTTWQDVLDIPAVLPEAGGAIVGGTTGAALGALTTGGAGAVPGEIVGQGTGAGFGTYLRHKGGQLLGVIPEDAPTPWGDIGASTAINAAAGPVLGMLGKGKDAIVDGVKAITPDFGLAKAAVSGALELPYETVKKAFGPEGRKLAQDVANPAKMSESARKLANAPKDIVQKANEVFGPLKDKAIRDDVWADHMPIVDRLTSELDNMKVPDQVEDNVIDVLESDIPLIEQTKTIVSRIAALGENGNLSAAKLDKFQRSIDAKLKGLGAYSGAPRTQGMNLLADIRESIKNELEKASDRAYEGTTMSEAYKKAKIKYQIAREYAEQFAGVFGVDTKNIGGDTFFDTRDIGNLSDKLKNITNDKKEEMNALLKELPGILPAYKSVVDDVLTFAETKPFRAPQVWQTGKAVKRGVATGAGSVAGAGLGYAVSGGNPMVATALGTLGAGLGYVGDVAMQPAQSIKWMPAMGEAARSASGKVSQARNALGPLAEQATVQAVKPYAGPVAGTAVNGVLGSLSKDAQGSEIPALGTNAQKKQADPGAVVSAIQSQVPGLTQFVKTNYGANYARAKQAGIPDDVATLQILSSIAARPKFGAGFGSLLKNLSVIASKSAGAPVSPSDIQWALQEYQ